MPKGGNQALARCPENEFIELLTSLGPQGTADKLDLNIRNVYSRRANLEKKLGRQITGPEHHSNTRHNIEHPGRLLADIENGTVIVGSDAHYWPGVVTTAHRAFVKFIKEFRPGHIVCNGDIFDGASISRHPSIMWEKKPSVILELEACQERMGEIEVAAGRKARKLWPLGNHDARFETRLSTQVPEYANVKGLHLKDHFGIQWEPCWSLWINDEVVIKHRLKNGIHAVFNNTKDSGKTMVTGHLHSLKAVPWTNYNGTTWGVDTGTLADPFGPQFEYIEDGPRNWRGGFVVLTFEKGELRQPELCMVVREGVVDFRGKSIEV